MGYHSIHQLKLLNHLTIFWNIPLKRTFQEDSNGTNLSNVELIKEGPPYVEYSIMHIFQWDIIQFIN